MSLRIAIVDDEPAGIQVLTNLMEDFVEDAEIVGTYQSAEEAIVGIRTSRPSIVFSDIELKDMSGLDLIRNIEDLNICTVFVTAHQEYAIDAIRQKAFDYLLKPIRVKEFLDVIYRIKKNLSQVQSVPDSIMINTSKKVLFVPKHEIVLIKGEGSYCRLYLASGQEEIVSKNLAHYEREIASNIFFRTHQSYLVNMAHVKNLLLEDGLQIELKNGHMAPLTSAKKAHFLRAMKKKKI